MVNGITGSTSYANGQWVGYEGKNLELIVDLGKVTHVSKVSFNSLNDTQSWVHAADKVELAQSGDGRIYNVSLEKNITVSKDAIVSTSIPLDMTTRFLKVTIFCRTIPAGFEGAGTKGWLFVDEVVVD